MYNTIMDDFMQSSDVRSVHKHAPHSRLPHVHLAGTGGTIAMRLDPGRGGAVPIL
jgi:L-asparaginase/Glu-tRNA(Gln) amidotransferase subunit D